MTARRPGLAAVLWDLDGTLVDSEKVWQVTLDGTAEWLGGVVSVPTRLAMVGRDVDTSVGLLLADVRSQGARPAVDVPAVRAHLLARTLALFGNGLEWQPGARELLGAVRAAGLPAALVTSTVRMLADVALAATPGLAGFDAVVCGDEVSCVKPAAEPYRRAAELLGVDPVGCVAVEDSPTGVASAEAAGCCVLAVPSEVPIRPRPGRAVLPSLVGVTVADLAELVRRAA